MKSFVILLLWSTISAVYGSIVVTKDQKSTDPLVAGLDQVVTFTVYNMSPDTITDITVSDNTFKNNKNFTLVQDGGKVEYIEPGSNGTISLVVRGVECEYRDKPAHVTYYLSRRRMQTKSSSVGLTRSISEEQHMEAQARKGWSRQIYYGMAVMLVGVPFGVTQGWI